MTTVGRWMLGRQVALGLAVSLLLAVAFTTAPRTSPAADAAPVPKAPPVVDVPNAKAASDAEMKKYTEVLTGTEVTFDMVPIPGGEFEMGSPEDEADREEDEGPVRKVKIAPFWMGKCEVSWDEYDIWSYALDKKRRDVLKVAATARDDLADAVTKPTKPYTDMTFGMGHEGYPAICMTSKAAKMYCDWLTEKTGRYYRLPTEAEWEYACRAGTTTRYHFGDEADKLTEYDWTIDNSDEKYQKVGKKKPNPWGLFDMHGNVQEWCLDQYVPDGYKMAGTDNPVFPATKEYPQVVRGGSWESDAAACRSAAREASNPEWKVQDPQIPKSIWYHTDALFVGFRVVRPLVEPTAEEKQKWDCCGWKKE
jgi:formylglycine-generating enzyme required for sulfatase activity